jgi:hypothetical protein
LKIPSMAAQPLVATTNATRDASRVDEGRMPLTFASLDPKQAGIRCT